MAYTINLTDGTVFATVADGTVNTSSSMILVGKNYAGYGEFLDENFIHLLENSSNTTAPSSPLTGQLWWDKTNTLLKVYNGTAFKTIAASTAAATQPTGNVTGDLWYDTVNQQLKVYTGAGYIVVGPAYTSTQGTTGAIPETINDASANPHYITSLYVNNNRVAIVSKDTEFVPSAPIVSTFANVYPGITVTSANSAVFAGTATNSNLLDSLDSTDFMRATANASTTGIVRVLNNTGLFVGTANVFNVNTTTTDANVKSAISGGNLVIQANVAGTTYNVATALGSNGTFAISNAATVGSTLSVTGNVIVGNISTTGNVTGGNLLAGSGIINTTGNITGGNLLFGSGRISGTGNITGGNILYGSGVVSGTGNVAAGYFLGNGSQLTGLSAAVSVTKFSNGTTEGNIGASGGNVTFTVAGTANVVVIDSTALYCGVANVGSIAKSGSNAVGNIGSATNYFNQVFATATTALYADVAERFEADELLEPGTVVEIGGIKEITKSRTDLSNNVFGVISTRPAYTMNGGAGEDATHPKVAMTGRVPVKVIGRVNKGDRLVSAGDGLARSAQPNEITAFNVIGRALVDKKTPEQGTIEAIVTIKN